MRKAYWLHSNRYPARPIAYMYGKWLPHCLNNKIKYIYIIKQDELQLYFEK